MAVKLLAGLEDAEADLEKMNGEKDNAEKMRSFQTSMRLLLLLLGLTVVLGGAGAETPAARVSTPTRVSYTFPFTSLFYGAPIVQARINDTVAATFLVDTGASSNAISQTLVDKLGLKPQITNQIAVPSLLKGKETTFVSLQKVLIGSLTLQGGAYIVLPAEVLDDGMKQKVDGVISMQTLRYFAVDLDFPRHQMTLWFPNGLNDEAVKQAGFSDAFSVSLLPSIPDSIVYDPAKAAQSAEAYWNLKYFVPVQISDNKQVSTQNLLLDSGSGVTTFPSEVSRNLKLEVQETIGLPKALYGTMQANIVQAPSLQIGSLHLVNCTVGILQARTSGGSSTGELTTLGVDVLSGYRLLIDFGAKKMYFKSAVPQIKIGAP